MNQFPEAAHCLLFGHEPRTAYFGGAGVLFVRADEAAASCKVDVADTSLPWSTLLLLPVVLGAVSTTSDILRDFGVRSIHSSSARLLLGTLVEVADCRRLRMTPLSVLSLLDESPFVRIPDRLSPLSLVVIASLVVSGDPTTESVDDDADSEIEISDTVLKFFPMVRDTSLYGAVSVPVCPSDSDSFAVRALLSGDRKEL